MRKRLYKKGWSEQEIKKAEETISKAEKSKHPHVKLLDKSLYWIGLIIAIMSSVLFAIMIIPLLIIINNSWIYFIVILFGLTAGTLATLTIKDLHWLESHHRLLASMIVPLTGLFAMILSISRTNQLMQTASIQLHHNPVFISVLFMVSITIPYINTNISMRKKA